MQYQGRDGWKYAARAANISHIFGSLRSQWGKPMASRSFTPEGISPIEEIIEEAAAGRCFILLDSEERENQGDLIVPAGMATPEIVNFMAMHARGLICLALSGDHATQLGLQLQPSIGGPDRFRTAFAQSIEAKFGVTTGISAHDRAHTIAVAIDPASRASDIVSPGHIFPIITREGGVLERDGHSEGAVDIVRLAGHFPAAVLCEMINEDGSVSRPNDIAAFAREHGLKFGHVDDLVAYRLDSCARKFG